MKKILILLLVLFIPIIVNADTWLDKEEYRDLSWFNENTYSTTDTYTIDTPKKMAGLLYLVNVKDYTFAGKTIKLSGNTNGKNIACSSNDMCLLDMSEHEWVSLDTRFDGFFGSSRVNAYTYIYVETDKEEEKLINKVWCDYNYNNSNGSIPCSSLIYVAHSIKTNVNSGGKINVAKYGLKSESINVEIIPDENYYIEKYEIKDSYGNIIRDEKVNKKDKESIVFNMPGSTVYINASFKKLDYKKCRIVTGTGNNIGDEIVCGSESFYVVSSDDNEVKMLAKYNLYAGEIIYKEKIEKEAGDTRSDEQYCLELAYQKGGMLKHESVYEVPGYCFIAIPIDESEIKQKENALSAHWDESGNYLYPQVGDVYISAYNQKDPNGEIVTGNSYNDFYIDLNSSSKYDGFYYDLNVGDHKINQILNEYKSYMSVVNGIKLKNIDLMTLDDINQIIKKNNKSIPYEEWYNTRAAVAPPRYEFAYLHDYLTKEQEFLYSTTYWLRTGYEKNDTKIGVNAVVFIDSFGGVCGGALTIEERVICGLLTSEVNSQIGCGIRPIITISKDDIEYSSNQDNKYMFIEGMDQTYNLSKDKFLIFRVNMEYEDFINGGKIFIDGIEIDSVCYEISKDSTIITFKNECIKKLSIGKHEIIAKLSNGDSASTNFTIIESVIMDYVMNKINNPDTEDKIIFIISLLILSVIILRYLGKKRIILNNTR